MSSKENQRQLKQWMQIIILKISLKFNELIQRHKTFFWFYEQYYCFQIKRYPAIEVFNTLCFSILFLYMFCLWFVLTFSIVLNRFSNFARLLWEKSKYFLFLWHDIVFNSEVCLFSEMRIFFHSDIGY